MIIDPPLSAVNPHFRINGFSRGQRVSPAGEERSRVSIDPSEKLHKVLARAGLGSRRACEDVIRAGRVRVDGVTAGIGDRVAAAGSRVEVDGRILIAAPPPVYVLLHKPPQCVTTMRDPQGRPTVADLVGDVGTRVFPVGRLDYDAEGLLLLTNDGALANLLMHPRHEVPRTYLVTVLGVPAPDAIETLRSGVRLDDGMTAPAGVELLRVEGSRAVLRMEMHEGRNRQIKRMCKTVGHPVVRLRRLQLGPIRLGRLACGSWRLLTPQEVTRLRRAARE